MSRDNGAAVTGNDPNAPNNTDSKTGSDKPILSKKFQVHIEKLLDITKDTSENKAHHPDEKQHLKPEREISLNDQILPLLFYCQANAYYLEIITPEHYPPEISSQIKQQLQALGITYFLEQEDAELIQEELLKEEIANKLRDELTRKKYFEGQSLLQYGFLLYELQSDITRTLKDQAQLQLRLYEFIHGRNSKIQNFDKPQQRYFEEQVKSFFQKLRSELSETEQTELFYQALFFWIVEYTPEINLTIGDTATSIVNIGSMRNLTKNLSGDAVRFFSQNINDFNLYWNFSDGACCILLGIALLYAGYHQTTYQHQENTRKGLAFLASGLQLIIFTAKGISFSLGILGTLALTGPTAFAITTFIAFCVTWREYNQAKQQLSFTGWLEDRKEKINWLTKKHHETLEKLNNCTNPNEKSSLSAELIKLGQRQYKICRMIESRAKVHKTENLTGIQYIEGVAKINLQTATTQQDRTIDHLIQYHQQQNYFEKRRLLAAAGFAFLGMTLLAIPVVPFFIGTLIVAIGICIILQKGYQKTRDWLHKPIHSKEEICKILNLKSEQYLCLPEKLRDSLQKKTKEELIKLRDQGSIAEKSTSLFALSKTEDSNETDKIISPGSTPPSTTAY